MIGLDEIKKICAYFEKAINNIENGAMIVICTPEDKNKTCFKTINVCYKIPIKQIYFTLHKLLTEVDNKQQSVNITRDELTEFKK